LGLQEPRRRVSLADQVLDLCCWNFDPIHGSSWVLLVALQLLPHGSPLRWVIVQILPFCEEFPNDFIASRGDGRRRGQDSEQQIQLIPCEWTHHSAPGLPWEIHLHLHDSE